MKFRDLTSLFGQPSGRDEHSARGRLPFRGLWRFGVTALLSLSFVGCLLGPPEGEPEAEEDEQSEYQTQAEPLQADESGANASTAIEGMPGQDDGERGHGTPDPLDPFKKLSNR